MRRLGKATTFLVPFQPPLANSRHIYCVPYARPIRIGPCNIFKPSLTPIPELIEFIGPDPFVKETENLVEKIREYRRIHGLTEKELAEQLGVDQTTLAGWEIGEHKLSKNLLLNLTQFFATFPSSFS